YEPFYLAQELGYYQASHVRLIELSSTNQVVDALRANKVDTAALSLDEAILLRQEGLPLKVIWVASLSDNSNAILVRDSIQDLSQLKDKRIGVEQTAIGYYMLSQFLQFTGLNQDDIHITPMSADEHLDAWQNNKVDALITFGAVLQILKKQHAKVVFDDTNTNKKVFGVVVATEKALACCSTEIQSLIQGQQKALEYIKNNEESALISMAKRTQSTSQGVRQVLTTTQLLTTEQNQQMFRAGLNTHSVLAKEISQLVHQLMKSGLLSQPIKAIDVIDSRFMGLTYD
ncbi:MAG: ABC transporter substrate-binding protein, partial [Venatoribacter sp.]